jgi:hypothetical protein
MVVKTAKAMYRNAVFFFDVILILNHNLTINYISVLQFLDLVTVYHNIGKQRNHD